MTNFPKILIVGYGAWARAQNNPAAAVAQNMGQRTWQDCDVISVVAPVETDRIFDEIKRLILEHKPDVWIGMGVSSSAIVQPETIGINCLDFDVSDASGKVVRHQPIIPNGPAAYPSSLPNARMVEMMRNNGIPAAVSSHAGTHLCNQMLYLTEHLVRDMGLETISGFIHIPQTPENIVERGVNRASMTLEMSCAAAALAIEVSVQAVRERHDATPNTEVQP